MEILKFLMKVLELLHNQEQTKAAYYKVCSFIILAICLYYETKEKAGIFCLKPNNKFMRFWIDDFFNFPNGAVRLLT